MVEQYELIITFTTLFLLSVIFLVICLHNNEKHDEFEETQIITIEDRCFDKPKPKKETKIPKRIPKRIIQTYFCRNVPERMYNASLTFKELNPDYEYIFYDDDRAKQFLKENFDANVVKAFDILIPGAYKADLFRICELYINGGYYADIFMENLKPLSYFDKYNVDCILVRDDERSPNSIYNAFIGCVPKNKMIKKLIHDTVENVLSKNMGSNFLDITGPVFIGKRIMKYLNINKINLGKNKNILFLYHKVTGGNNYVCHENEELIKTKYQNYIKDIKPSTHYAELYKAGKVFKDII